MLCIAGPSCRFPVDWKGQYYQSGVGVVVIRGGFVTTKGVCVEQERDYYLFNNRSHSLYALMLLLSTLLQSSLYDFPISAG